MKLKVVDINGKATGRSVELPEKHFGVEPNDHVIYLAVKQYLANQRQGTHATKERNAVKGSTKKIKRQKGTGTARAGDIKNPLFRGGGRVFGPRPDRNYSFKLNKKEKQHAMSSALSHKAKKDAIVVVEDFTFDAPRTKKFVDVLGALNAAEGKTLFITEEHDHNLALSCRNVPKAKITEARILNIFDVMKSDRLVISEKVINRLNKQS